MSLQDRLASQPPVVAATGAFRCITGIQEASDPAAQVLGLATAFKHMTDVLNLDPRELLYLVARMEHDCYMREDNTLAAVREYVTNEIRSKFP